MNAKVWFRRLFEGAVWHLVVEGPQESTRTVCKWPTDGAGEYHAGRKPHGAVCKNCWLHS